MKTPDPTEKTTTGPRRRFLTMLLGGWTALSLIPMLNVVLRFLMPKAAADNAGESLKVESYAEIPLNSSKIVRFGKDPVLVIHTESGQFKAFYARCTHLGCVVKYESEDEPHIKCNCHSSVFDMTGKNLTGPAPRPLIPLRVTVQETSLLISRANA
jgi:cytochrome b6-f complex iron-sulfur subunit